MPNFAIYKEQIITPEDIYKFNIDKSSEFLCYNCDKKVHFRQQRNADINYTEHFYHPNTVKDTYTGCDSLTLDKVKDTDTWHNMFSGFIEGDKKEIIRRLGDKKHIVDAYDAFNEMGVEFQNSPISVADVQSRDTTTHLNWIFNCSAQYMRKVKVGGIAICEIPHDNWEKAVQAVKNKVLLWTGHNDWILLENRDSYRVQVEGKLRNVWIGKPLTFADVFELLCLTNILTEEGINHFNGITTGLAEVEVVYGRCKKSMFLLDDLHREYVNRHEFKSGDILAVKSVAGSGKTTTLLKLAKIHSKKKILYLAFNKALITDIEVKIKSQGIRNLYPSTFDKVLYQAYCAKSGEENTEVINLTAMTIQNIIPWLRGKPFKLRDSICRLFTKFCGNPKISEISDFACRETGKEHPMLSQLWKKVVYGEFITFDAMRKLSLIGHWFSGFMDAKYDMIMIDETQDFDMMMLRMLLDDTTIPKIFVGDTKQAIYQWRGCINGFEYLPAKSLVIEFYSTFRVGDPACEIIRTQFKDCWMISKSKNHTTLNEGIPAGEKYTYLFRTWRGLLTAARGFNKIYIHGYAKKITSIRKLHQILTEFNGNLEEEEFEDDLPKFLKSLSVDDLENLISSIDENLVSASDAMVKFYTIHSYKGLEDDNVRIASDDLELEEDENLYYVALTRGMKNIVEDWV
jgi:UvrD-like helicase C-terminal domain